MRRAAAKFSAVKYFFLLALATSVQWLQVFSYDPFVSLPFFIKKAILHLAQHQSEVLL